MSKELAFECAVKMVIDDAINSGRLTKVEQIESFSKSKTFKSATAKYVNMFMSEFK